MEQKFKRKLKIKIPMILSSRFPEEKLLGICQGPLGWLPSAGIFLVIGVFSFLDCGTGFGVCSIAVKC